MRKRLLRAELPRNLQSLWLSVERFEWGPIETLLMHSKILVMPAMSKGWCQESRDCSQGHAVQRLASGELYKLNFSPFT
jgi:hypothetical protein